MVKRESGPLKFIERFLMISAYTVITLFLLFVGFCVFNMNYEESKGKEWCERVIRDYDTDQKKFLETHSDLLRGGNITLKPTPKDKGARGLFSVTKNGEYICRYWTGGVASPHGYEYTSKNKEWEYIH